MDADRHTKSDAASGMPKKLKEGPATERVQIVAPVSFVRDVDEFRRLHPDLPNRSEAIRILVAEALEARKTGGGRG